MPNCVIGWFTLDISDLVMHSGIKTILKKIPGVRRYAPRLRALLSDQPAAAPAQGTPLHSAEQIAEIVQSYIDRTGAELELFKALRQKDLYLLRDHYYRPFVNAKNLPAEFWTNRASLASLEIDANSALTWAETELTAYFQELRDFLPLHQESKDVKLYLINGTYMAVDAHMYYALIRHLKPKTIIEVGAGHSTLFAHEALKRGELLETTELHVVEPYPEGIISSGLESVARVRRSFVQDLEPAYFDRLEAGDILFIDSTHVVKEGGDVLYLYLEILPRLKPGVFVHVHDISLPEPYPSCYLDYGWFWNEQYLLQAYLVNNNKVKILWPGNYLMCYQSRRMLELFPDINDMRAVYPESEPSAFWFKTL